MRHPLVLTAITTAVIFFAAPAFASTILNFDLMVEYSGGTPPTGPDPWLHAVFADVSGGVELTLINGLYGSTEFVPSWMFNLDPALDPLKLNFTIVSGTQTNAVVSTGKDEFRAAGGGYFDIRFAWPTAHSDDRFKGGEAVTYLITSSEPITAMSFESLSAPGGGQGPFPTAAKVQGIGPNDESGWITVPEPTALWFFGLMLAVVARRNTALQQRPPLNRRS